MKDKKDIKITINFQEILDEAGRKPSTIKLYKDRKVYNRSMKLWFQDDDIGMYTIHCKEKSIVAEKIIRT